MLTHSLGAPPQTPCRVSILSGDVHLLRANPLTRPPNPHALTPAGCPSSAATCTCAAPPSCTRGPSSPGARPPTTGGTCSRCGVEAGAAGAGWGLTLRCGWRPGMGDARRAYVAWSTGQAAGAKAWHVAHAVHVGTGEGTWELDGIIYGHSFSQRKKIMNGQGCAVCELVLFASWASRRILAKKQGPVLGR